MEEGFRPRGARFEAVCEVIREQPAKWLVTGVAGFIGSHLLQKLLTEKQEVIGLDNFETGSRTNLEAVRSAVGEDDWARFTFVEGDITDPEACARGCQGVEFVLHQAALGSVPRSIAAPVRSHQVNVSGFVNVVLAARDAG